MTAAAKQFCFVLLHIVLLRVNASLFLQQKKKKI